MTAGGRTLYPSPRWGEGQGEGTLHGHLPTITPALSLRGRGGSEGIGMKIVRFNAAGKTRDGVRDGTRIVEHAGTPDGTFKKARKRYAVKQAVLLAPVAPSKIAAAGLNYRDHAEEMRLAVPEETVIFLKPLSALGGPDDPIIDPSPTRAGWTTRASWPS